MCGLLPPPCRTLYAETFMCAPSIGKVKFQHCISMHHAVMQICTSHRHSITCAKNWFLGGFEGEDVKILCSDPQKALPCMNTCLLVYRVSKSVQQSEL